MAQFSYDVVPHKGGWAILVTLGEADAFATKQAAYDVAVELARKLRFAGFSLRTCKATISRRRRRPAARASPARAAAQNRRDKRAAGLLPAVTPRGNRTMPDLLLELFSEEIPARMQPRAAEDLQQARHRQAGRRRPRLRGRQGVRDAAAAGADGAGRAGAPARREGGEQGPARRRARRRDRRASSRRRGSTSIERGQGAARQEGRLLRRGDREAGPRRRSR